ncbi:hypothetical protein THIOM_004513 [Candidatus Thiomargarita nelsonii]|uniref:Uncharacterized protein n=1 Tax=Candidatus Thiomargarita nelsonii TaxID=1003181 RepID=A0A176RVR1_9GAMM|nr:hypothetical protein THIOM_004513 [Candidatus Thiomargarita nelsonii]
MACQKKHFLRIGLKPLESRLVLKAIPIWIENPIEFQVPKVSHQTSIRCWYSVSAQVLSYQ